MVQVRLGTNRRLDRDPTDSTRLPMSKRIVLFIDGTGCNGQKDKDRTNVWKLHNACLEPKEQQLYLRGVGTGRFKVMGGLAGFGTRKRLEDAYNFLVKNHNKDGDHVFLFGFSRGALAVRLFADFLGHVGKLFDDPVNRKYLYRVYQIYEVSALLGAAAEFRAYMRHFGEGIRPLPIHFIGVWDTVEEYWSRGPRPDLEKLPDHISVARHALALHERRSEMEPTLWKKWSPGVKLPEDQGPRVMQVWFPGAHSDVGGGYQSHGTRLCGGSCLRASARGTRTMRGESIGSSRDHRGQAEARTGVPGIFVAGDGRI